MRQAKRSLLPFELIIHMIFVVLHKQSVILRNTPYKPEDCFDEVASWNYMMSCCLGL